MVEEVKHSTQKERRIIDTIEPVMARHKLILDSSVIEDDYKTAQRYDAENKYTKTLVYQLTRVTYDRGALKHDDRLDALAIAVNYWVEQMSQDEVRGMADIRNKKLDDELEKFIRGAVGGRGKTGVSWVNTHR
jgi:DNA maturase B